MQGRRGFPCVEELRSFWEIITPLLCKKENALWTTAQAKLKSFDILVRIVRSSVSLGRFPGFELRHFLALQGWRNFQLCLFEQTKDK